MISDIIKEQRESVLKRKKFIRRAALDKLISLLSVEHILSIIGVRRCGKSVLMKELIHYLIDKQITSERNILYLNLENPYFNQFKDEITYLSKIYHEFKKTADSKKKIFIFFDEIQFFKDWQVFIKDLYEKKEAKIILTGSNSKLLSSELATLLSGRTITINLYPYSYKEFFAAAKENLSAYLEKGGFPEISVIKDKETIKLIIETYYKNIIYQDVIPRFGIKNSLEIENLSYYLLSNVSKELSYNTLKNISKLDDKTIKQYISYLEDANLLYTVYNYDPSLKKQIGNKKKIYSVDSSFVNFLGFSNSRNIGRLLENAVFIELKRKQKEIFFYSNVSECDFIIKKGYRIAECIQVTKSLDEDSTRKREINFLISTLDYFKLDKGIIITEKDKEKLEINGKVIEVLPYVDWASDIQ
ncbi:ATP-binding protein [Candidatus Woesearchaeota archaeon]|nr:ATP-binding protein [Candidatus Woesearchaeota archaeon]